MEALLQKMQDYLQTVLGIQIQLVSWSGTRGLPVFLCELYLFYEIDLFNKRCLVMVEQDELENTPSMIQKHMVLVKNTYAGEVIYLRKTIVSFTRKRLIEQKVPFIVPGNQMYLPFLGIDLREHYKTHVKEKTRFSPAAQVVIVYALLHDIQQEYTLIDLSRRLNYTAMTMTRAIQELEAAAVCMTKKRGRKKIVQFIDGRKELWEKGLIFMRNPIKRKVWIQGTLNEARGAKAGLTALAEYSMLAAPKHPVYAVGSKEWHHVRESNTIHELPCAEPKAIELEIWKYDPMLFVENNAVDQFSLYLSLRESQDERVETALTSMMEKIEW